MQISKLARVPSNRYYTEHFLLTLELHLEYLTNSQGSTVHIATPQQTLMFVGDFYGLLHSFKIPSQFHFVTMRVNNLLSSSDYDGSFDKVVVPDLSLVESLLKVSNTKTI